MHFASQWYYYYHLTHIKPGMFLSKNYFCKKKNGAEGLYSMHEQGQKKPWWHTALQDTGQKKGKKKKWEKWGTGA